jgi:competence protein ComEC
MKIKFVLIFILLIAGRAFFSVERIPLSELGYSQLICEVREGNGKVIKLNGKFPLEKISILFDETEDGIYSVEGNFNLKKKWKSGNQYEVINLLKKEKREENIFKKFFLTKIEKDLKSVKLEVRNFFKATVLGQTQFIHKDFREKFSYTGTSHLLAISGLHFGIVIVLLSKILEKLPLSREMKYILEILLLTFYISGIVVSPSSFRAYIMGLIMTCSKFFYEGYDIKKSLRGAFVISLLLNPLDIFNVSFQLSYMALFTIIYIVPKFRKIWMGLIIQIFLTPIVLINFGQLPILAFLANFILMPIGTLLITLCFLAFIFSIFGFGKIILYIVEIIYKIFKICLIQIAEFPHLSKIVETEISLKKLILIYIILFGIVFAPEIWFTLKKYKYNIRRRDFK